MIVYRVKLVRMSVHYQKVEELQVLAKPLKNNSTIMIKEQIILKKNN